MEKIDKNNDTNESKYKKDLIQILPDYITSDILLRPALCIKAKKKDTSLILSKLKKNNLLLDKVFLKNINYQHKNFDKEYQKPNENIRTKNENVYEEYEGNFFKRVKKINSEENLIVISFKDDLDYKKITKEKILKDYEIKEENIIEVNIPCMESITEEQYQKNNKIWPQCNYISSKEKNIYMHSDEEKNIMLDLYNNNILDDEEITCLLYDPKLKKILIKAKKNEKSVIGHDIMNMLEIYSNKLVENNNITKHENNEKEKKEDDKDTEFIKLGEKNPIGPKENTEFLNQYSNINENEYIKQYYCEGLYVITKEEPCIMCAMALIHNRISRLYFCDINEKEGALISKYSLDNYKLNHHYLIFQIK